MNQLISLTEWSFPMVFGWSFYRTRPSTAKATAKATAKGLANQPSLLDAHSSYYTNKEDFVSAKGA